MIIPNIKIICLLIVDNLRIRNIMGTETKQKMFLQIS